MKAAEREALLATLAARFSANMTRHADIRWADVQARLEAKPAALTALKKMEETGGEPDVIGTDASGAFLFCDCVAESPAGRRSLCYDRAALDARKEAKPAGSAMEMAHDIGGEMLTEADYALLQSVGAFDLKTSSWLHTPADVRARGGALFGDKRYGRVFTYHNGVQSYYAVRGFRVLVRV